MTWDVPKRPRGAAGKHLVRITHGDRPLTPGTGKTAMDLATYCAEVAK